MPAKFFFVPISIAPILFITIFAFTACFDQFETSQTSDVTASDTANDEEPAENTTPDLEPDDEEDTDINEPMVTFITPVDGSNVSNPVNFRIAATGVEEVEIYADETYSLGSAWNPADRDSLLYRFAGTGFPRSLHVVGRTGGVEVARENLTITVEPDTCEELFFVSQFDSHNRDETGELDLTTIREQALTAIKAEVTALQDCGANVSLGAMMSLLLYEGGFRVCAFNTRCRENSYHRTESNCDDEPEALYSYQFGLGAIHTSNFHPCKGGAYTQSMRRAFLENAEAAGFPIDESLLDAYTISKFHDVCPNEEPNAVDYYLLEAHDIFGIPRNASGNHLIAYGTFPLFSAEVSLALTFRMLAGSCADIASDRDAIRIYGGGDASYAQTDKQNAILGLYEDFANGNCE